MSIGVIEHVVHGERCRVRVYEVAWALSPVAIDEARDRNIGKPAGPRARESHVADRESCK